MKVRATSDAGRQRKLHPLQGKDISNPKSAPGKKPGIIIPKNQVFQPTETRNNSRGRRDLKTPWILTVPVFIAYIDPTISIPSKKEEFWLMVRELKGSRNTRESKWSMLILKIRCWLTSECPRSGSHPSQMGIIVLQGSVQTLGEKSNHEGAFN